MNAFILQPHVYSTCSHGVLRTVLEETRIHSHTPGRGTIFVISGFANFNGGARFYKTFTEHVAAGGGLIALFGANSSSRMTSRQVVDAMLECGAKVYIVNRKQLFHSKLYGKDAGSPALIVTSGNFTGRGISANVEACISLDRTTIDVMGFKWSDMLAGIHSQKWQIHEAVAARPKDPVWSLLYDESKGPGAEEDVIKSTLVVTLGYSDTARIMADRGTDAGKGSQYFWISKDSFDFFPALTIRNKRGIKGTLSAEIAMRYLDLPGQPVVQKCRVTFEADNNLDFRLGTGKLRYTKLAQSGDLACISRVGDRKYELRIISKNNPRHRQLSMYAIHAVGHKGKLYGLMDNHAFEEIAKAQIGGW